MAGTDGSRFLGGQGAADPQLKADIQKVNGFSEEQLAAFVQVLLRFVCAHTTNAGAALLEDIRSFADAHGVNARVLKNAVRSLLLFFQGALKHNMTPSQVEGDLAALGLGAAAAAAVAQQWRGAASGLAAGVAAQALSVDRLVDMEWRFGVTASTSELGSVGATFLQLKLRLEGRDGGAPRAVHLELTLPQFYEFLAKMEKYQAYVDYLADTD